MVSGGEGRGGKETGKGTSEGDRLEGEEWKCRRREGLMRFVFAGCGLFFCDFVEGESRGILLFPAVVVVGRRGREVKVEGRKG